MSLKINPANPIGAEIKASIINLCEDALEVLEEKAQHPHDTIHELRKKFKKIRAQLRLIRDSIDFYSEENKFFRDEARKISDIRDATSVIEALYLLYAQYEDQLYKSVFTHCLEILEKRRESYAKEILRAENKLQEIEENLKAHLNIIENRTFEVPDYKALDPSIQRVYKRGKKAYEKARENKTSEDFHEWRKRVKYLRYQLRTLKEIWPEFKNFWEDELHELSDLLGTDRDLLMLKDVLEENKAALKKEEDFHLLEALIKKQRQQLQKHALLLGHKLYHFKPKTFTKFLLKAWETYLEEKNSK